eukprot:gnl/MRDRNA2_/MRDRNA2_99843_c0_seq1.p1 gnl/MRDRNA2_/MRDRNA2_99843_c0~~gnl/MRDRNA2_/MRDRNA2_99843_c0_seq1.p1  ORF type:complete len:1948 (-),score=297.36 gnl/MRDRNA2_/MRDRNA2_99843_c0_seq1:198-6041(-)
MKAGISRALLVLLYFDVSVALVQSSSNVMDDAAQDSSVSLMGLSVLRKNRGAEAHNVKPVITEAHQDASSTSEHMLDLLSAEKTSDATRTSGSRRRRRRTAAVGSKSKTARRRRRRRRRSATTNKVSKKHRRRRRRSAPTPTTDTATTISTTPGKKQTHRRRRRSSATPPTTTTTTTIAPPAEEKPGTVFRTKEKDARFLIQASFGPTRASMKELSKFQSYEAWIKDQMALPIESHREYYRARANPRGGVTVKEELVGSPRGKCDKGSRWLRFAFSQKDNPIGGHVKKLTFVNNQIFVDGQLRTAIEKVAKPTSCSDTPPPQWQRRGQTCKSNAWGMRRFCPNWRKSKFCQQSCFDAGYGHDGDECDGGWQAKKDPMYICGTQDRLGGKIKLSSKKDCKAISTAVNPALWFPSPPQGAVTILKFTTVRPDVIVLAQDAPNCKLGDVIRSDTEASGQYYHHDTRLALLENTLEHPHAKPGNQGKACSAVPKSFLNEKSCQLLPGCTPLSMQSVRITLNKDAIQKFHAENMHVYLVRGIKTHGNKVYDFSEWVLKHPAKAKSHIQKHSVNDIELKFTKWDEMQRWELYIGKYGETIDFSDLPQPLQTQALADAFGAVGKSGKLEVVCGSPGEIANDPVKGHRASFFSIFGNNNKDNPRIFWDSQYDVLYDYGTPSVSRASVWLMKATYGNDQLRQRMAWALAQIFVVSGHRGTEQWLNYYDIFVRHAFGNFKNLLREVTYSPIMGDYLTYKRNTKFEFKGNYPDENYAREVMQLFSIGLWKLNPDGSRIKDKDGNDVPTYSNDQIMNIARVFTGFDQQQGRSNYETSKGRPNPIDPMRMHKNWHDQYPKPDLDGNFLGDGYPLCADIPSHAFLAKGAKYVYIGDAYNGPDSFVPSEKSPLFSFLCRRRGDKCSFKYTAELDKVLACYEDECKIDMVKTIKITSGDSVGYYEFVPPVCVHLFFYNGKLVREGGRRFGRVKECANPDQLNAGISCCGGCPDWANGWVKKKYKTCDKVPEKFLKRWCRNHKGWNRQKACALSCAKAGVGYEGFECPGYKKRQEKRICAYKGEKARFQTANSICKKHGLEICPQKTTDASADCGLDATYVWTPSNCSHDVVVHSDGTVSSLIWRFPRGVSPYAKKNKVAVQWDGPFPSANEDSCSSGCSVDGDSCKCKVQVETKAVFNKVPSKEELLEKLKIGSFPPLGKCTLNCKSSVRGFTENGVVDQNTIFEFAGQFYKNAESIVHVGNAKFAFRNPPVFMGDVHAEVDSFLEYLLKHPNTPVHIGRLLIQRLVTSNPSPQYIQDVGQAFRSGHYDGTKYSGQYGDLGATLAAILLNPEARQLNHDNRHNGRLREPLVKIVHLLRSMEYKDTKGREIQMRGLLSTIGQWPYEPDSVFNFYLPDYQPDRFPNGLVAPEFQIFTPPLAMGFLNGMFSLIQGGLRKWGGGFGNNKRGSDGKLTLAVNETLAELDLLLTGGRLNSSMGTVLKAYENAKAKNQDGIKAAQKVIMLSPEFNTLGDPRPAGNRKPIVPEEPPPARDYKAVVMLFLDGGADTFNMIVPQNCDLYKEYVTIRQNVALRPNEVQKIATIGQDCKEFGIHAKFDFVKKLYDQKKAAFVSNVGSLAEPMTKGQMKRGAVKKCTGLFSHSDMQVNAQTLHCQVAGRAPKGYGGRLADALASSSKKYRTSSFSLAGNRVWSQGFKTTPQFLSRHGTVRLHELGNVKAAIDNLTRIEHDNIYCEEYAKALAEAVESTEELGETLKNVKLQTKYEGSGRLNEQLKQVARVIAARKERKVEREVFFVSLGGFDTHAQVTETLDAKFTEIDEALRVFVAELEAQQIFDETVVVTHSDFARTLTPNGGEGTDHAWAGNHMIIGGGLKGGRVFNKYPTSLLAGNEQDAGRGRIIPKYPWESMMVPIAHWMGMDSSQSKVVFPNLANFNSTHIIPTASLFK